VPELPEVESARRLSEQHLIGNAVEHIDVRLPKLLRDSPIPSIEVLIGATLTGVRRRAKVMVLEFGNGLAMLMHFKLAGQWAIFLPDGQRFYAGHPIPKPDGEYPHRSTHATFVFSNGTVVQFSDIRQFGWWRIMDLADVDAALEAFGFGPEATSELDATALVGAMGRRGIPIKTLLLDQSFIAGLGSIYVDEVLWRARVHPATPAKALSTVKRRAIVREIPDVMAEGIRQGGAKIIHNVAYPDNGFPSVHAREGEPCMRCGTAIQKTRVGARGTYFCPKCQKVPKPPYAE
jgi:formamidopyrimidine-DNA glycosylase